MEDNIEVVESRYYGFWLRVVMW